MQSRPPEANNPPPPIEPTGFFTGIKIRPVIIGVVVDIVATMMLSTLYYFIFVAKQLSDSGAMSETLDGVRIERVGRLAHVFADFRFTSRGSERPGQLMLLMIEDRGQFRIAALAFTYHVP